MFPYGKRSWGGIPRYPKAITVRCIIWYRKRNHMGLVGLKPDFSVPYIDLFRDRHIPDNLNCYFIGGSDRVYRFPQCGILRIGAIGLLNDSRSVSVIRAGIIRSRRSFLRDKSAQQNGAQQNA